VTEQYWAAVWEDGRVLAQPRLGNVEQCYADLLIEQVAEDAFLVVKDRHGRAGDMMCELNALRLLRDRAAEYGGKK